MPVHVFVIKGIKCQPGSQTCLCNPILNRLYRQKGVTHGKGTLHTCNQKYHYRPR